MRLPAANLLHLFMQEEWVQPTRDILVYVFNDDHVAELNAELELLDEATSLHVQYLDVLQFVTQPFVSLSLWIYQNRLHLSVL